MSRSYRLYMLLRLIKRSQLPFLFSSLSSQLYLPLSVLFLPLPSSFSLVSYFPSSCPPFVHFPFLLLSSGGLA